MYIRFTDDELNRIRDFAIQSEDCEQIGENEFVLDLFDLDAPVTLDIVLDRRGAHVEGAAFLSFDEEMDGWYMDAPIEREEDVRDAIARICGL